MHLLKTHTTMIESHEFLRSLLDTVSDHIAVINPHGKIVFVNRSWCTFGINNSSTLQEHWDGINYLDECDRASEMDDDFGTQAAIGIRKVINAEVESFYFEYPCHSPDTKRWFMMRVNHFQINGSRYFVISHQNITERKLAEEKVSNLSKIDGLTGIPNRRHFDEFSASEWERCRRLKLPVSLAIIDLDHFKMINDTYGHQVGDNCLIKIGSILKSYANRPSDLYSRYGGEEFVIIYGNTRLEHSKILMDSFLNDLRSLKIPNEISPVEPFLTASIGLVEMHPNANNNFADLFEVADNLLYEAKEKGRNQVVTS